MLWARSFRVSNGSIPEFENLGGKRHRMDIIFPLFPSKFIMFFSLSSTENIISYDNLEGYEIRFVNLHSLS